MLKSTADQEMEGAGAIGELSPGLWNLIRETNDAALVADDAGRYIAVNSAACEMLGYTESDLLGATIRDLIPTDPTLAARWQEFLESARMHGVITLACKDGRTLEAQFSAVANVLPGVHVSLLRDVSAYAARERQLQTLELAVSTAKLGIWRFDLATKRLEWNDELLKTYGYTRDEFDAHLSAWEDCLHPDDVPAATAQLEALDNGETMYGVGFRIRRHSDGAERHIMSSGTTLKGPTGEIVELLGIDIDVTEQHARDERLASSESRFRALMHQCPLGMAIYSMDGTLLDLNEAMLGSAAAFAASRERLVGSFNRLEMPAVNQPGVESVIRRAFEGQAGTTPVYQTSLPSILSAAGVDPQGVVNRYSRSHYYPIAGPDGAPVSVVQISEDVSDKRRVEDALRDAAAVFESILEAVAIVDASGTILDINPAFSTITGYTRFEAVGSDVHTLNPSGEPEVYRELWEELDRSGRWKGELWSRRSDGIEYAQLLTVSPIGNGLGNGGGGATRRYVFAFSDITPLKRSEARLDQLAHRDLLTDLPNRRRFETLLGECVERSESSGRRLALMFLDIDRFKDINDTLGHPAGDALLQQVAARVSGALRSRDILARVSGDEFVAVLVDVEDPAEVTAVAHRVLDVFMAPFRLGTSAETRTVSASIGIALSPDDATNPDELLANADIAMYRAKESGGSSPVEFYDRSMTETVRANALVAERLAQAISSDSLSLAFQPQYTDEQAVFGVESLLRWHDSELGDVSPSVFIPVAERTGLIDDLGCWVLRAACAQARRWLDEGIDFGRLAVNVSARQLRHPRLVPTILETMAEAGLAGHHLTIEVTETALLGDVEHAGRKLEMLRDAGIHTSIDDFGTGYSSLAHLKRLPVNSLKIDRSFVDGLPDSADDQSIASAVVALGHSLNLSVVAEGVEKQAQLDALKAMGCRIVQGFLTGRPVEAEVLTAALRKGGQDA